MQGTHTSVLKQIFSACTHEAYDFFILWYASSYVIAYVKGNTDIHSAKNTNSDSAQMSQKLNSSNCGFNSAFALHQTDHTTAGILPLMCTFPQLTLPLCKNLLNSSCKPDSSIFQTVGVSQSINLMCLIEQTPYENVRADHRRTQVAFSFHNSKSQKGCVGP